jgi:hypothetical protein
MIDCLVSNGATLVCVSRMWMVQSPPVSSRRKEFPDACSEYQCSCVFLRYDDVINACLELLRQDFESQRDEDRSRRTKGARVLVLLDSLEELFLWRDDASPAKVSHQISLWSPMLTRCLLVNLPNCSPAT